MPEQGEARLAAVDIDDYFSSPATRKAAAHIRGRLRSPNANLPQGDEDLARLVAKLTVEAHRSRRRPPSSSSRRSSSNCTGSSATSPRPGSPATRAASGRSPPSASECGRVPASAELSSTFPSDTRTSVRVVMDRETLAAMLEEAARSSRSRVRRAERVDRRVLGEQARPTSRHASRHAARGGIEREEFQAWSRKGSRSARSRQRSASANDGPALAAEARAQDAARAATRGATTPEPERSCANAHCTAGDPSCASAEPAASAAPAATPRPCSAVAGA